MAYGDSVTDDAAAVNQSVANSLQVVEYQIGSRRVRRANPGELIKLQGILAFRQARESGNLLLPAAVEEPQ